MRFILALIAAVLLIRSSIAQAPVDPAPVFKLITSTAPKKGEITYLELIPKIMLVDFPRPVIVDGQRFIETVKVEQTYYEKRLIIIDAAKSRIMTPDGTQLPIDEVWKRIKANTIVAISPEGKTPAQPYLRALGADTLIIIPPAHVPLPSTVVPRDPPPKAAN